VPPRGVRIIEVEELMPPPGFLSYPLSKEENCGLGGAEKIPKKSGRKKVLTPEQTEANRRKMARECKGALVNQKVVRPNLIEALIDRMVASPAMTKKDLAAEIGRSEMWVTNAIRTDEFKEKLAARKEEIIDPLLRQTLAEQFEALASISSEILLEKLMKGKDAELALKCIGVTSKALGYGAAPVANQAVSFVVQMPTPISNSRDWEVVHSSP